MEMDMDMDMDLPLLFFLFRLLSNISYQHHPPTVLHIAEEL
ncbi:MAG: hypothetical protein ACI8RD_012796, partial [Bacillariaceae sp.]